MKTTSRGWLFPILVAAIGIGLFSSAVGDSFLFWDDWVQIVHNPNLSPVGWPGVYRIWTQTYHGLYDPLTLSAFVVLKVLASALQPFASEAAVFHAANVLLHALNGVFVFFLIRAVLREPGRATLTHLGALLGAVLFVCHPLQVESVAWATSLKDVLSTSLGLLSLLMLLAVSERTQLTSSGADVALTVGGGPQYVVATLLFGLAVLAKPNIALLPVLAWPLAAYRKGGVRKTLLLTLPWLLIGALAAGAIVLIQSLPRPQLDVPLWLRPFEALANLGFYATKLAWPFHLSAFYDWRVDQNLHQTKFWLLATIPVAVAASAYGLRRRCPGLALGLVFTVIALLPVLGFIPYEYQEHADVADRYMYLPMIGIALAFADLLRASARFRIALPAAILLLAGLAVTTSLRLPVWAGNEVFYRAMLVEQPNNAQVRHDLGYALKDAGKLGEAFTQFEAAQRLAPNNPYFRNVLQPGQPGQPRK